MSRISLYSLYGISHNYPARCSLSQSTFHILLMPFSSTTVLLVRQEFFNHLKLNVCQQCILLTVKQLLFRRNATRINIFKGGFIGAGSFPRTTCSQNDQSNKSSINCTITAHRNNGPDIMSMKSTERFPLTAGDGGSKGGVRMCVRYRFLYVDNGRKSSRHFVKINMATMCDSSEEHGVVELRKTTVLQQPFANFCLHSASALDFFFLPSYHETADFRRFSIKYIAERYHLAQCHLY